MKVHNSILWIVLSSFFSKLKHSTAFSIQNNKNSQGSVSRKTTTITSASTSTSTSTSTNDNNVKKLSTSFSSPSLMSTTKTETQAKAKAKTMVTKSYVEFIEPTTQVKVVLLGCLHGSLSSANDVRYLMTGHTPTITPTAIQEELDQKENNLPSTASSTITGTNTKMKTTITKTDAVVLELCESRLADFQRVKEKNELDTNTSIDTNVADGGGKYTLVMFLEDLQDFWKYCDETRRNKGIVAAFVTFSLGSMSILQTNLSGFRPGLEFAVALDLVEEQTKQNEQQQNEAETTQNDCCSDTSSGSSSCRVVLADRDLDDTMERIGKLPQLALEIIRDLILRPKQCWEQTIVKDSRVLGTAIFGDDTTTDAALLPPNTQVCMPKVLVRSKDSILDLLRLTLSPLILSTVFLFVLGLSFGLASPNPLSELDSITTTTTAAADLIMADIGNNDYSYNSEILQKDVIGPITEFITLGMGYALVSLPASRVIISERDTYLSEGIRQACREIAAAKEAAVNNNNNSNVADDGDDDRGRIVAVLGLLHVNGVAKQLLLEHTGT